MVFFAPVNPVSQVTDALRRASAETGIEFDYLLKTAMRESGLKPDAKAATSSAAGLFQFIDSTWLRTLKEEGPKYGLGDLSSFIQRDQSGAYSVADPDARSHIMALREDPEVSAIMAGALTQRNASDLASTIGRSPTNGELYIAHFLGSGSGAYLIRLAEQAPETPAANVFPRAAAANKSIFYDAEGQPRGAGEVYAQLVERHEDMVSPILRATAHVQQAAQHVEEKVTSFFQALFQVGVEEKRADGTAPFAWMKQDFDPALKDKSLAKAMDVIDEGRNDNHIRRPAAKPGTASGAAQQAANSAYGSQVDWAESEAQDHIALQA